MSDIENDPVPADPPENGGGTDSDLNLDSQTKKEADPPENGSGGGT